ncbi:alpha/beta hydrolase [Boeremia exigua]|uniref:alpha/beta hydrolase n=1 Tax=Boeremia exigua TaxID=749465 RepID=UPI001E8E5504|nr:alpha/beta hydrolase [Boeremia exigua]KAH6619072.1 alpha/beta hydrolase [Boeremia exigua]
MFQMQHLRVPHLSSINVAYYMPKLYDRSKATLVLIHGFSMSSHVFTGHFQSQNLTSEMNLLGIDVIGHGETRVKNETFTYWDTAIMIVQLLDALSINEAFILRTSHGGCIAVRTYLIAPKKDAMAGFEPLLKAWTSSIPTPDFELDDTYCNFVVDVDFGHDCPDTLRDFWKQAMKSYYSGDDGRRKLRMAAINLRDRDSLHGRLAYVHCPVLWLQGTEDAVNTVANAKQEIDLIQNSLDARLQIIEGGLHVLSHSHQEEVERAVRQFVAMHHRA